MFHPAPTLDQLREDIHVLDGWEPPDDLDVRVVANVDWDPSTFLGEPIRFVQGGMFWRRLAGRFRRGLLGRGFGFLVDLGSALALVGRMRRRDSLALLNMGLRDAAIFCFLNSFLKLPGRVLGFGGFLSFTRPGQRWFRRRVALGQDVSLVWSRKTADSFNRELNVDRHLAFPYKANHSQFADESGVEVQTPERYLFSGGNSQRDYATLVEAARGLDIAVVVSRTRTSLTDTLDIPANVQAKCIVEPEYREWMRRATGVVIPLNKGLLRGHGEASFLNAMWHGKAVVVADDRSAEDYIESGVDGIVVPPGDVAALREALLRVWGDASLRESLGRAAREKAERQYTHERWKKRLFKMGAALVLNRD